MAKGDITLSKEHGVNPSVIVCPICGKETGLAFLGKLKDDAEAPPCVHGNPCDECQKKFDEGYVAVIAMKSLRERSDMFIFVPREVINVEVKGNVALMELEEFLVTFKPGVETNEQT